MPEVEDLPDLRGDRTNIILLVLLYVLQGVPLGLTAAIPFILQNQGASYTQQAEFSFALWPFSLKLLWAPLVDSLYIKKFGRRKTWLVPAQYLIGISMLFSSMNIDSWLGNVETKENPQIMLLTVLFFIMNSLAATQDIALDGWALTMLKKENKSYASTCNSVGQTTGYFLGYVVFIALESASFCNSYLRSEPKDVGIITLPGFMFLLGISFLVVTTLIAVFKSEKYEPLRMGVSSSEAILSSYRLLINILCLPNVKFFAFVLLTAKIGFAACDGLTGLKLMQGGIPKEKLAILAVPLVPLQIVLPIVVAKFNEPGKPLNLYFKAMPYRLYYNFVAALFVFITPKLVGQDGMPTIYYVAVLIVLGVHSSIMTVMYVQIMSFFAIISDTAAGGTYMTLFNTLCNLGGTWSSTLALWLVDYVTLKSCSTSGLDCSTEATLKVCDTQGGKCHTWLDGYYIETFICSLIGFIWYRWGRRSVKNIQDEPLETWKVKSYSSL